MTSSPSLSITEMVKHMTLGMVLGVILTLQTITVSETAPQDAAELATVTMIAAHFTLIYALLPIFQFIGLQALGVLGVAYTGGEST